MQKWIFCFIIITTNLWAQTATPPAAGDGSSGTPYQISTLENLYWLSQNPTEWSKHFVQTADIEAATTSGWDSGAGWTPIGNSTNKFTGTYSGQSFAIHGLFIERSAMNHQGLFGYLEGATIQNLGVKNGEITGATHVAALAAYSSTSTITDCYTTGKVIGNYNVGGLVGTNMSGKISQSYSTANVFATGTLAGGLVGLNQGSTIRDCYTRGNVSRISETRLNAGKPIRELQVAPVFGGFVGFNHSDSVRFCYSTGQVSNQGLTTIGFCGNNNGVSTANFFDSQTSGQISDIAATAKTTSEMKTQTTFTDAGWDFATIWEMVGENYPRLRSNPELALPVELSNFTASLVSDVVVLYWATESEVANLGFILERRTEGADWTQIASYTSHPALKGQGTTSNRTEYVFIDDLPRSGGNYFYRLSDVGLSGEINTYPAVFIKVKSMIDLPRETRIDPAYPNPFNPLTAINYHLAEPTFVELNVFDPLGRKIKSLQEGFLPAGSHFVVWDGTDENGSRLPSGVYLIFLQTDRVTQTQRVLLLK